MGVLQNFCIWGLWILSWLWLLIAFPACWWELAQQMPKVRGAFMIYGVAACIGRAIGGLLAHEPSEMVIQQAKDIWCYLTASQVVLMAFQKFEEKQFQSTVTDFRIYNKEFQEKTKSLKNGNRRSVNV